MNSRPFDEVVAYEVAKITKALEEGDTKAPSTFFNIAVGIQNKLENYSPGWLDRKKEIACAVLSQIGTCHKDCKFCALQFANIRAKEQIEEGLRSPASYPRKRKVEESSEPKPERKPVVPKHTWIDKRVDRLLEQMKPKG